MGSQRPRRSSHPSTTETRSSARVARPSATTISFFAGSILVGGLAGQAFVRLELDGGRNSGEARYLQDQGRIRDIGFPQNGAVMILTGSSNGALFRLTPDR
ncbi:PQQ-dependent sugar dehydrogenase [Alloyangia pacifica]|uniref:PQQ-dependent sugar dehydrogenase n=1 Tax=Alloyangia pacifica TaxID=311180 RepID=UPI003D2F4846